MRRVRARVTGRRLLYLIVGFEMLFLGAIVASQELNIALDSGAGVDLDIVQARARKDPFRGAHVSGESALDLDGPTAAVPSRPLEPGDRVLVFFTVEAGRRPRITRVERRNGSAPPFSPSTFTIPGKVRPPKDGRVLATSEGRLVARVGSPPIVIQLELPASIAVDDVAVDRVASPSLIRARLHRGFLDRRYLDDVRLLGRGWTPEMSFVYDESHERLVVFSPLDTIGRGPRSSEDKPRTDVFIFDALGVEVGTAEISGRVIEGVVDSTDGQILALVSDQRWGYGEASLCRIRQDGQVTERSAPIGIDRILGFDSATGSLWVLVGTIDSRSRAPVFVERMALSGNRGPRLGPFTSVPRTVRSLDGQVWVVETERHRITRLELTSGRTVREYRDLNDPTDVAADGESLYVIEANRSQLTKFAGDGRLLWRVPRFSGLAWVLPELGTGGGWVGASAFGDTSGVLRFAADGSVSRVAPGLRSVVRDEWRRRRLGSDAVRSARSGRLYVLDVLGIAIVAADGVLVKRVDGFRFPREQRLRS